MAEPDVRTSLASRLGTFGPAVVFATLFSLALQLGYALTNRDGDLGRHLRLGLELLDLHRLPLVDHWSHTLAGEAVVPHEWLAQAVFALLFKLGGFTALAVFTAALVSLPFALLGARLCDEGEPPALAVLVATVGGLASAVHWMVRPHVFTFVFLALFSTALDRYRLGRGRFPWWLVPAMALWANFHGAFVVGFVVVGLYVAGALLDAWLGGDRSAPARARSLAGLLGALVLASFVNPAGPRLIAHSFGYLGNAYLLHFTAEYNSPDFHHKLLWPLVVLLALPLLASPRDWTSRVLLGAFTAFALYALRNVPLYAIVATPLLARALSGRADEVGVRLERPLAARRALPGWLATAAVLALGAIAAARQGEAVYAFQPGEFPVRALEKLGAAPPGRYVFNKFEWGGYLLFCCAPRIPVFIDGQTDFYGPDLTRSYEEALNAGPRWREVLDGFEVDWTLLPPDAPLAQLLALDPGWREAYRDDVSVVHVRQRAAAP